MGASNILADSAGRYVQWGAIQISVTNLVIVLTMVLLFVLALLLPFPKPSGRRSPGRKP